MVKRMLFALLTVCLICNLGSAFAKDSGHGEPAPNSGNGVPDGSGYDSPNGPNSSGSGDSGQGHGEPAPNSGDGIPDGPGWEDWEDWE